jgi:hypothetical protein
LTFALKLNGKIFHNREKFWNGNIFHSHIQKRLFCETTSPKNVLAFSKITLDRTNKDSVFFEQVFKDKSGKLVLFDSQLHPLVSWKNPQK